MRHAWWRKNISYTYPRVLMYHMITQHLPKNKSKFNRLRVKPKEFEKQVQWLKNNGWTSYTLSELVALEEIPSKSVVLTFDDGYEDNYTKLFPILQKYQFKATIYLVTERFEKNWATDKDKNKNSQELNNERMLTHEQVKEMLHSGLVEIGSHTLHHVNLPALSKEQAQEEIYQSKKSIENAYHITCNSFAYPFGYYDEEHALMTKESQYTNATSTENGIYDPSKHSPFLIPRIMISGRQSLFDFILKIKKGRNR